MIWMNRSEALKAMGRTVNNFEIKVRNSNNMQINVSN